MPRFIRSLVLAFLPFVLTDREDQAQSPERCEPSARPLVYLVPDSQAALMTGTFRLVLVTTSYPGFGTPVDSGWTLTLNTPDSAQRAQARERTVGHSPRQHLQLLGSIATAGTPVQPAELENGVLYLGCRDCNDASPLTLRLAEVSVAGFRGTWRDYQTGIGRVFDSSGKPAPDPAGYFCAVRTPNGSPRGYLTSVAAGSGVKHPRGGVLRRRVAPMISAAAERRR